MRTEGSPVSLNGSEEKAAGAFAETGRQRPPRSGVPWGRAEEPARAVCLSASRERCAWGLGNGGCPFHLLPCNVASGAVPGVRGLGRRHHPGRRPRGRSTGLCPSHRQRGCSPLRDGADSRKQFLNLLASIGHSGSGGARHLRAQVQAAGHQAAPGGQGQEPGTT